MSFLAITYLDFYAVMTVLNIKLNKTARCSEKNIVQYLIMLPLLFQTISNQTHFP